MRDYEFVDGASRWETGGTANYPGAIGLAESVGLINEFGTATRRRARAIADGPPDQRTEAAGHSRGHGRKTAATAPASSASRWADVDENVALTYFLQQHKVLVSVRYTSHVGGVRVSCHLFNNRDDIDRLLELVGVYLRQHAKATV